MISQSTFWKELASAAKIVNKSVSRIIKDYKFNQLTMTCHCKKKKSLNHCSIQKAPYIRINVIILLSAVRLCLLVGPTLSGQSGHSQEIW